MRVLVCGGAGFTGRAIVEALLADSHIVRAWDLRPESWTPAEDSVAQEDAGLLAHPQLERVYGDIADYGLVEQYMAGCEAVVHASMYFPLAGMFVETAAIPGARGEYGDTDYRSDEKSWLVNLKGLWNVLESARQHGGITRVVHIGSAPNRWPGVPHLPGKEEPGSVFLDSDVRRVRTPSHSAVQLR